MISNQTVRDNFIRKIIKEKPDMNVIWIDKKNDKRWQFEKSLTELTADERKQFNLRKQFPNEIILDIEERYRLDDIAKKLNEKNWSYEIWDTGSRGIHISIIFNNLAEHPLELRNRIRKYIINRYETDEKLAKESQWLALEWTPHMKTGKEKTLVDVVRHDDANKIDKDTIDYCIEELEKKKRIQIENTQVLKDFHKEDPFLKFVLNNTIEAGDRNNVLFKNLAIGLAKSGLSRDDIETYAQNIIVNCPGKNVGEFMGWVDKVFSGELQEYNKTEMNQWAIQNGYNIHYKLADYEEPLDMLTIKQLWDEIWNRKIACQPIWKDLLFYNMIGTILDERQEDLRIHIIFSSFSSSGKDEGINIVQDILDRMGCSTKRPATVTDKTLVGGVNQSKIDFNIKHQLSEEDPENKGKIYKDPVEKGWLENTNWLACTEAEFIFKPGAHNRHIGIVLRQAMDKARRIDKGVAGYEIPIRTNTSFILTTYTMNATIGSIIHNGLFQRTLFYNKIVSDSDHREITEHINKMRFNKHYKVDFDEKKYMDKFLTKLKMMKKWYEENRTKIDYIDDSDKVVNALWKESEKGYSAFLPEDRAVLNSMIRRSANNLYKMSVLNAAWKMKNTINHNDIRECYELLFACVDGIKTLVMSQDKNRKQKYSILQVISRESISKMNLHYEMENTFKIKNINKRTQMIKQLQDAEYISDYKNGRETMLNITDKGRNYLIYEDDKAE